MEMAKGNEFLIGFDALFRSMNPDSAIVFLMFTILIERLVSKGVFTQDEVADLSVRAYELIGEIQKYFGDYSE